MNREDELFRRRIAELAGKCYSSSQFIFTDFLNPSEISRVLEMEREIGYVDHTLYGGAEHCERKILRFGSKEMFGYEEEFPISCVEVTPLMKKFSEELSHRDYLGALMNLGIERSTIGDIFVRDKTGYLFCVDRIGEFIVGNLDKVRHTNVKCRIKKGEIEAIRPDLKPLAVIVNSERIDGVISKICNLSRSQSVGLFREKKVFVNGRCIENNSYILKEGEVVSVRGYGKFIFDGPERETRKGKMKINIRIYE